MMLNLIIGPDFPRISPLTEARIRYQYLPPVIYHYKDQYSLSQFDLPENAHLIISAHGSVSKNGSHKLNLFYKTPYTNQTLEYINSNKMTLDVELISCYSGAAINDISSLSQQSTLITITSSNYIATMSLPDEILNNHMSLILTDNPFIKFASYIFINPNDSKFAINSMNDREVFSSLLKPYYSDL